LSTDAKLTYIIQNVFNKPRVGEESSVTMNLYKIPRSVDLSVYKNAYQLLDANTNLYVPNYWTTSSIYTNPYWSVYNTHRDEDRNRIIGMASVKYELTPWLNIQGRVSLDKYNDKITQKFNANTLLFAGKGGSYSIQYYEIQERNMDLLLTGNNNITKDLKVSYSVGSSVLDRSNITNGVSANGLLVPNKFDLNFAQTTSFQTGAVQTQLQSAYGTAQLNYKDYLYLDITGRNDWSSTLPNPYAYFYPSVGITAVLSDMIKLPGYVDFAKIRLSSTQVGNDAPAFLLAQTYGFSPGGTGGFISRDGTQAIANLKPELTTAQEIGTEWRFLKGRLGVDLTLYKTNSKNQLLQLGLAPASGFSSQYINAGNIENKGIELQLTGTPISRTNFKWDVGLNYALNVNKVVELSPDITKAFLSGGYGRTAGPIVTVGGSYGDLYAFRWARNTDGSFQTDTKGRPVASATQEFIGNYNPKYTLGLTNSFTYKNFVVNVLIDGKVGGVMTSGTDANLAFDGTAPYTTLYRPQGSWTLPGASQAINAETFWTTVSGGRYSWGEFFTYDATNFRVREFSLGYKFTKMPAAFVKGIKLSLVARNLFFLYRGKSILDIPGIGKRTMNFDPDINLGNGNYQGVEYGTMPSTRSIGLNLKLSF
jgi:outer membrane receptor protein involved in Fe transport